MPTGYTYQIENGEIETGKQFLEKCCRAINICVDMKDESLSVEVPYEISLKTYHKEKVEYYSNVIDRIRNISLDEASIVIERKYTEELIEIQQAIDEERSKDEKYKKVREEVEAWCPPTKSHEGLKKFALQQINTSIENTDYYTRRYDDLINKPRITAQEYLGSELKNAEEELEYHNHKWELEKKDCERKNKWLRDFRESFVKNDEIQ